MTEKCINTESSIGQICLNPTFTSNLWSQIFHVTLRFFLESIYEIKIGYWYIKILKMLIFLAWRRFSKFTFLKNSNKHKYIT